MLTDQQHPITPPLELVERLRNDAPREIRDAGVTRERHLVIAAYRAGADAELEACVKWMLIHLHAGSNLSRQLRAARRPKPPSLAEEALEACKRSALGMPGDRDIIRRALERLQELESNG